MSEDATSRVTAYARDVTSGQVAAGRLVRLACQRHLDDLEGGAARGLDFQSAKAARAIGFIERFLRLMGGEHEGRPFLLQPWQAFIVGCLFGWLAGDGHRRFRTAYIEIGKGNGKSPLAAAIGLYLLMADGEPRAEVYAAATKRDQAMVLFRDAVAMVKQSPHLGGKVIATGPEGREWNLAHAASGSWFRPIASDDGQSGPRPHGGLIDEVHEHRTSHVIDMMRAGTKGRRQALILEITNSGFDRDTVCWHHHRYSEDIVTGKVANDSWFAYICGLDVCSKHLTEGASQPQDGCPDCDDWRDESVWQKANPNLGVSIQAKYLREQVEEAKGIPTREGLVKRLNFCWWTEGETAWLPEALWAKGAGKFVPAQLIGRPCYGGLDIASRVDVASFVLCFPDFPEPGHYALLPRFWIPRAGAEKRAHQDGIPWLAWAQDDLLTLTAGDVIDQDTIEEAIKQDAETYQIVDVGFDPWNATQLAMHLIEYGVAMVEFAQTLRNFNEPTKQFEGLLKEGNLHHGSHPVLDWMAGNVSVISDANGNIRPVKPERHSPKKVDGIVAAVMALGRAMLASAPIPATIEVW